MFLSRPRTHYLRMTLHVWYSCPHLPQVLGWDCHCASPCLVYEMLGMKFRPSCILGKHTINLTTSLALKIIFNLFVNKTPCLVPGFKHNLSGKLHPLDSSWQVDLCSLSQLKGLSRIRDLFRKLSKTITSCVALHLPHTVGPHTGPNMGSRTECGVSQGSQPLEAPRL